MADLIPGQANQQVFADTLLALARENTTVMVVTSDSRGSGKLVAFGDELPAQIVEVGIAEQNLVGISAGLASTGKVVYAVSPACFLTARALEQIKNDVAYSDNRVNVIGISAGVSYGTLGTTHHSLHDYAVLRAINNIDIIAPADNFETRELVKASLTHPRPLYIRLGKKPMPHLHAPDASFEIGKAITIREGHDITLIANGETTPRAVMASNLLAEQGIDCRILSMHTIRPFDEEALIKASQETGGIITIEEHSLYGGLGELCASFLLEHGLYIPFKRMGIPDEYTVTGSQDEILDHYGMSPSGIVKVARQILTSREAR